jgi:hypothetical protein
VAQVEECLPSKHKALNSNSGTTKNTRRQNKTKQTPQTKKKNQQCIFI